MADYLPLIAVELRTTVGALENGELPADRATREELLRMRQAGQIQSDDELEKLYELATQLIRKRSKVNIPLNQMDITSLLEVLRGADGY